LSAPSPSVEKFVTVAPFAVGDDVPVDLTGPESASGWTLEVKCSYSQDGAAIAATGVTATYQGGATFVIRLTFPRSFTSGLEVDASTRTGTLYVELRRTDSGYYTLLRRLKINYFARITG